jgi:hypothetical protein
VNEGIFSVTKDIKLDKNSRALQPSTRLSFLTWACFALLAINALAFVNYVAAPHIRADIFRHLLDIVLPFLQGKEDASVLWTNHHPVPLLHLLQIVNLKLFGFRLDYDAYFGLFFQVLTTLLILVSIRRTTLAPTRKLEFLAALGAILIASIALGFNSLEQYTWPLLTLQQYLHFFGIAVFLLVHRSLLADKPEQWYFAVAVAALLLIFANGSFGTIFLASIFAVLVLVFTLERRSVYLHLALVIAAAVIVHRLFMHLAVPVGPAGPSADGIGRTLKALLMNPAGTLTRVSIGLSSGLVDIVSLKDRFPQAEQLLIFMAQLLTFVYAGVLILYLKKGLYRKSTTPLALMIAALLFGAASLIFRFWYMDTWGLATPRYVPNFKLGIIGMLWALWLIVSDTVSSRERLCRWPALMAIALGIGALLFIQGMQIYTGWGKAPMLQKENYNHALGVFLAGTVPENNIVLPFRITGLNKDKKRREIALTYLKNNNLNVFSEEFPASPILDQYKASRRLFNAADTAVIVDQGAGKAGRIAINAAELNANWEIHPGKTVVHNTSNAPLYLRVQIQAKKYISSGILTKTSSQERVSYIDLYRGSSNLYFSLQGRTRMDMETLPGSSIEAFEIRR